MKKYNNILLISFRPNISIFSWVPSKPEFPNLQYNYTLKTKGDLGGVVGEASDS